jgi:hypothetical protein
MEVSMHRIGRSMGRRRQCRPRGLRRQRLIGDRAPGWFWGPACAMTSPGCSAPALNDVKVAAPERDLVSNRTRSPRERTCSSGRGASKPDCAAH